MVMAQHYDQQYFFSDLYGGKKFVDSAGQSKEFGYAQGGLWSFQGIIDKLLQLIGYPNEGVLDLGAGCGGFVATLQEKYGISAVGFEFSKYAIEHAILGAEKYLVQRDLEETPWPIDDYMVDWVTAIDLFEHLFSDKVDEIIRETKRVAGRWIIAKICTAKQPYEVWCAKRARYEEVLAQAKREGFEWLIVSGHVTSQTPEWWINKFADEDWKNRSDLAEKLKKDLNLPDDWRCTLILEDIHWFEREFGKNGES